MNILGDLVYQEKNVRTRRNELDWIHFAEFQVHWRDIINTVAKFWFKKCWGDEPNNYKHLKTKFCSTELRGTVDSKEDIFLQCQ